MKKSLLNRGKSIPACVSALFLSLSLLMPQQVFAYTAKQGSVTASSLNVRVGAGTSTSKMATLPKGSKVTVIDETGSWYKIQFTSGTALKEGYVLKTYISFEAGEQSNYTTNAAFEQKLTSEGFPESYKKQLRLLHAKYPNWVFKAQKTGIDWEEVIQNESIVGRNLVHRTAVHSWKSTEAGAYNWSTQTWVGFDTNAWVAASEGIVRYYMDPRNFLDETYIFQFLDNGYSTNGHDVAGLEQLVKGSFLESKAVVGTVSQGETASPAAASAAVSPAANTANAAQTSQPASSGSVNLHTSGPVSGKSGNVSLTPPGYRAQEADSVYEAQEAEASYEASAANTAFSDSGPGVSLSSPGSSGVTVNTASANYGSGTYVDIIMRAGQSSGVNPYVLAAMIIQEQGVNGNSGLISGNTSPYQGYFNFFNIEAYQKGDQSPVQRGLWWASQSGSYGRPWNSREKAIIGGADYYGSNYVKAGQNTLYLKKFNVMGANRYKHQYMTNVEGAAGEGAKLSKAYSDTLKNSALEFCIPIYNNMPEPPEPIPTGNALPSANAATGGNASPVQTPNTGTTESGGNAGTGETGSGPLVGPGANLSSTNSSTQTQNTSGGQSNVSLVAP